MKYMHSENEPYATLHQCGHSAKISFDPILRRKNWGTQPPGDLEFCVIWMEILAYEGKAYKIKVSYVAILKGNLIVCALESVPRPRGITSQGGIVHYKSSAFILSYFSKFHQLQTPWFDFTQNLTMK